MHACVLQTLAVDGLDISQICIASTHMVLHKSSEIPQVDVHLSVYSEVIAV